VGRHVIVGILPDICELIIMGKNVIKQICGCKKQGYRKQIKKIGRKIANATFFGIGNEEKN